MRMPKFEQELQGLIKNRKKVELTDTLLQLGLLKMTKDSLETSKLETVNELKDLKNRVSQADPDVDQMCKVIESLVAKQHELEHEQHTLEDFIHEKHMALHLELKKWEIEVRDAERDQYHMRNDITDCER